MFKRLGLFLLLLIVGVGMSSTVSAYELTVHTYGHGSVFKPASWTDPVTNISFRDKSLLLAWAPDFEIDYYLDIGGAEYCYYGKEYVMTSGSKDKHFIIPDDVSYIRIYILGYGDSNQMDQSNGLCDIRLPNNETTFKAFKADQNMALTFSGLNGYKNTHLKGDKGLDSGYLKIYFV